MVVMVHDFNALCVDVCPTKLKVSVTATLDKMTINSMRKDQFFINDVSLRVVDASVVGGMWGLGNEK